MTIDASHGKHDVAAQAVQHGCCASPGLLTNVCRSQMLAGGSLTWWLTAAKVQEPVERRSQHRLHACCSRRRAVSSSLIRVQVLEASFVVTANQWQCAGSASGDWRVRSHGSGLS